MSGDVTAIVSAYYAQLYLEGRIENLLGQTLQPEIVVVCQENSPEHKIAANYSSRVRVLTTLSIPTIYYAWNLALAIAKTEYITNANCDDRLYPFALQVMTSVLRSRPDIGCVYADSDIVKTVGGDPVGRFLWLDATHENLIQKCCVGPMPVWRRELHTLYGLFDAEMRSAGDYEFWLRVASRGCEFLHLPRVLGEYLRRSDSAERREPTRALWESARARERYPLSVGVAQQQNKEIV